MTLAKQLRHWQGPQTDQQAAAALGVPRETYRNWKRGHRRPRGLALESLLAKLQNPPEE